MRVSTLPGKLAVCKEANTYRIETVQILGNVHVICKKRLKIGASHTLKKPRVKATIDKCKRTLNKDF